MTKPVCPGIASSLKEWENYLINTIYLAEDAVMATIIHRDLNPVITHALKIIEQHQKHSDEKEITSLGEKNVTLLDHKETLPKDLQALTSLRKMLSIWKEVFDEFAEYLESPSDEYADLVKDLAEKVNCCEDQMGYLSCLSEKRALRDEETNFYNYLQKKFYILNLASNTLHSLKEKR
jgi:hypothetical protein